MLAAAAGNARAVRAVGTACATNPLPVVVPCHRVVRSDGAPGQYIGGADAKRALLALGGRGMNADAARTGRGPGPLDALPAASRVDALDWAALVAGLDEAGHVATSQLLTKRECDALRGMYDDTHRFRATIDMARYRFGSG